MTTLDAALAEELAGLAAAGLRRTLTEPAGLDFSSNDYLGMSRHPPFLDGVRRRLAAAPGAVTAPASRLLRGHTDVHRALERRLARFKGTEAALLFPSGYQANLGLLATLVGPRDRALSDAQNHASLIDGLRLAGCSKVIYPHLDVAAIEGALAEPHPGGRTFLVTESLFSMDGDIAPLDRYAELAARHGAALIVDDAHGTGIYGARGAGLTEHFDVTRRLAAVTSTMGKALGAAGAFVAASRTVIDTLINRCRPFVFSTAVPPFLLFAVDAALDVVAAEPERRRRPLELAARLRRRLRGAGLDCLASVGPIVPVVLGDNRRAVEVAAALQARGFDVRAIRPPTVPPGAARLRLSVHADHREEDVDALAVALTEVVVEAPAVAAGAP